MTPIEKIESLLHSQSENAYIIGFLAPQEVERLAVLIHEAVEKAQSSMTATKDSSKKAAEILSEKMKQSGFLIGMVDISEQLNVEVIFKQL